MTARVERLYRWALGRAPQERERQWAREFLASGSTADAAQADIKLTPWEQYAQALLSTNEFVFID